MLASIHIRMRNSCNKKINVNKKQKQTIQSPLSIFNDHITIAENHLKNQSTVTATSIQNSISIRRTPFLVNQWSIFTFITFFNDTKIPRIFISLLCFHSFCFVFQALANSFYRFYWKSLSNCYDLFRNCSWITTELYNSHLILLLQLQIWLVWFNSFVNSIEMPENA